MDAIRFEAFGPLHAGGLEIKKGGVDPSGVGLFTTLARSAGDPIGFYAGTPKSKVTRKEEEFSIEIPGFDLVVVPPLLDVGGAVDFEAFPMAAANEPPEGQHSNMVLVADRLYDLKDRTFTVLAFYASTEIQPHTELTWHYGTRFNRDYTVGMPSTAQFDIQMTLPRLERLLAHRPDAIFDLRQLELAL